MVADKKICRFAGNDLCAWRRTIMIIFRDQATEEHSHGDCRSEISASTGLGGRIRSAVGHCSARQPAGAGDADRRAVAANQSRDGRRDRDRDRLSWQHGWMPIRIKSATTFCRIQKFGPMVADAWQLPLGALDRCEQHRRDGQLFDRRCSVGTDLHDRRIRCSDVFAAVRGNS